MTSASAIVRNDKSFPKKLKVKRFVSETTPVERRKAFLKNILLTCTFVFLLCLCAGSIAFYYFYSQAALTVDRRISQGFWQTRSGIYAAPHVLATGQTLKLEDLLSTLRHSGYVEGENKNIWNGNFTVKGETVTIQTNHAYAEEPETITVQISKNQISSLKSGSRELDAYELQPEMISGNSEAKRGSVNTLKFEQIPEVLRNAIIVTEDRRFFEHSGFDWRGIARALHRNVSDNEITQGGSTVTQQLVKNIFLTGEKTFSRKFSEIFLALALESRLSKEDIFALYCNEIYLGQYGTTGIHGVEQASRAYFGKKAADLNLAEAATLTAMIKSPQKFSPARNTEASRERRNLVIQNLANAGLISTDAAEKAKSEEIALVPPKKNDNSLAPYFVDTVAGELSEKNLPMPERNLRVYTTIDPQLQELAEKSVTDELAKLDRVLAKKGGTPQAALVALDPKNGHVLAMVGGRDYAASQLNRTTEASRQPGSTFKPFVYAAALESGKLPTSIVYDQPMSFTFDNGKQYKPANYGNFYANGEITLKNALAKSSNVAAVETALETGLEKVTRTAEKFGLPKPLAYPSVALGTSEVTPMELAAAYASFANGGKRVRPTFISQIVSGDGDNAIYQTRPDDTQVVSPQTAYMITDMLAGVVERGTARKAFGALGENVAFVGKTGSSKDGWFVGYTPNLVCVVWVGFDDGNKDIGMTGGEVALPLWVDFMRQSTEARPELGGRSFQMPNGLMEVVIDPETGMLADKFCPQREKIVVPANSYSNLKCLRHQPRTEMMYAGGVTTNETYAPETYVMPEISDAKTYESETVQPSQQNYKSVNGIPVQRNLKKENIKIESDDEEKQIINNDPIDSADESLKLRTPVKAKTTGTDNR